MAGCRFCRNVGPKGVEGLSPKVISQHAPGCSMRLVKTLGHGVHLMAEFRDGTGFSVAVGNCPWCGRDLGEAGR